MPVVAKPVTWTLDPNQPRKTGSRYILSCVEKSKGSVTMSQKQLSHSIVYCAIFGSNRTVGHFTPSPLPG